MKWGFFKSLAQTDRQTDRQTELSNCTFVKTILMLLVVIYHCMLYWSGTWFVGQPAQSSLVLPIVSSWLNSFHIYAFTLVSGYLFAYLKVECGKYGDGKAFVMNKVKRLLIPYVFVSLIWVIPFAVYFFRYDGIQIIKKFALGISPNQLWFLLMLFGVFMIFYPLSSFFEKHHAYGAIVVILIYGIGFVGFQTLPNVFQIFRACTYLPLFWLGFKIRQCGSEWLKKIPAIAWLVVDILLFILTEYLSKFENLFFVLLFHGFSFLLHIIGALMAFVILQKIASLIRWKESKIFGFFSEKSMPIYLFHQQIVYLFLYWLNGINPYFHATINFIAAMLISLLLSYLMMKFKWTRLLIGEK